jgi:hypothetical protein
VNPLLEVAFETCIESSNSTSPAMASNVSLSPTGRIDNEHDPPSASALHGEHASAVRAAGKAPPNLALELVTVCGREALRPNEPI